MNKVNQAAQNGRTALDPVHLISLMIYIVSKVRDNGKSSTRLPILWLSELNA